MAHHVCCANALQGTRQGVQDELHRPSAPATRRSNTPLAEILMLRNHAPSPPVRPLSTALFLRRAVCSAKTARMPLPLQQVMSWQRALAPRAALLPRAATAGRGRPALPRCHSSATAHGACPLDACPLDACPLDASVCSSSQV